MPQVSQTEIELEVFREFARFSGLAIREETIEHRDPPEPDIRCELTDIGLVGFEITELIDHEFMARHDLMAKTQRSLKGFWRTGLPPSQSASFQRKYSNALLHFQFGAKVGHNERSSSLGKIFTALLDLPDGFTGDALRYQSTYLPVLEVIRIRRGTFVGPILDSDNFGWIGDPTNKTISRKLSKKYVCDYPIELVAYIDWDILPPDAAWMAEADKAVEALSESQLRRVWVFDRIKRQVVYVRPAREEGAF